MTVGFTNAVRAVKPMHAVNNGPTVKKPGGDQKCGNFDDYKAAAVARLDVLLLAGGEDVSPARYGRGFLL